MFAERLRQAVGGFCSLNDSQVAGLEAHYQLLLRWNKVLNLTAVRDPEEMVVRHYAESLFLASRLPHGAISVVDIGSGAGFPGVPVAIARPQADVTLVESHQRKAVFLREATREIGNIQVFAGRAEDLAEEFDWAVCRAVKYADIRKILARVSRQVAFLAGGGKDAEMAGMEWDDSIQLPWGDQRFLWLGSNVSRET